MNYELLKWNFEDYQLIGTIVSNMFWYYDTSLFCMQKQRLLKKIKS